MEDTRRRGHRPPRRPARATQKHSMTLAQKMQALRAERGLSFNDIAELTGLQRTTAWKIEKGFLPRGGTLEKVCLRGLGLGKDSDDWKEALALWTAERTGQPITAEALAGHMAAAQDVGDSEMARFYEAVSKLSPKLWDELQKAVHRPSALEGIAALNAIYDAASRVGQER